MAVPNAPTGLIVSADADSFSLEWTDTNAGAYPPRVYYRIEGVTIWTTHDLTPSDVTFLKEGLAEKVVYEVGVSYFDPGSSDESNMVRGIVMTTAGGVLIEDSFSEVDTTELSLHTPEDGGSWTENSSVWGMGAAKLSVFEFTDGLHYITQAVSSTNAAYYHSEDPLTQNIDIYWNVYIGDFVTGGLDKVCGVYFRASSVVKSGYQLEYAAKRGLTINRWDSGVETPLWETPYYLTPDGSYHELKLNITDSTLTLYHWEDPGGGFDWVQIAQVVDATHAGGKIGVYGEVANRVNMTSYLRVEAGTSPPGKPTITIADQGPDFVDYTSSAFSYGVPNYEHAASQWQVTLAADTGFVTPVIDVTATNSENFEAFRAGGLNLFLNQYIGRVRHQDLLGRWSEWSDASSASALETAGQFYTAFAERPLGIDIREDAIADWAELDTADGESTWFLEYRPDATCEVTMDRVIVPDTGDVDTVDPIYWEGFPSVAQQIVFGRFIFDTVQANQVPCDSGVADLSGIICREEYGLVDIWYGDDGLAGWRVARGETSSDADDPEIEGFALKTTDGEGVFGGDDVLQYQSPDGLDAINALIVWDGGGNFSDDYWYQVAWRFQADDPNVWYHWIGNIQMAWGIQSGDDDYFIQQMGHLCGLYYTYGWSKLRYYGVGDVDLLQTPDRISSPFSRNWVHNKLFAKTGEQHRKYAWDTHVGHVAEQRNATGNVFSTPRTGKLGLGYNSGCPYNGTLPEHVVQYDEVVVCTENTVRVLDLPFGWKFQIGGSGPHVQVGSGFWPTAIYGDGTDDQLIDFESFAFPCDTIYLTYPGSTEPDIVWDVPTGIWGGDVYRIKPAVQGAAGVAARLTGTPEGTDGSGYLAYVEATGGLILDKWSAAGGLVNLDAVPFDVLPGVYYNVVLEAVGTTIRAKAWAGGAGLQGDPEDNDPGTWMISEVDATYASGAPGLVALTEQPVDFDAFAVGLGGDPYPTGRYPGLCTWVNPTEGIILTESPLVLEWTAPPITADVIGMELSYDLEFQQAGQASWTPLASDVRATTYSWDLSNLPAGFYCVRVRVGGCEVGPWSQVCFQWLAGVSKVPEGYFFGDWYTGEADTGQWIRLFRASHQDDTSPVPGCLITRELMPAGVSGECLFQKLYVTITTTTTGIATVTPILDGDYLLEEQRVVELAAEPGELRSTQRYEVDLTRGFGDPERWRYGYRGTYFQVEICATDYSGQGRIEIDGVAVRLTVVRETHPWARPFVGELEVDVDREVNGFFFFGTTTDDDTIGSIYAAEEGTTDFGDRLRFLFEPNKHAPFGPSEEAWFRTLYVSFTRSNVNDVVLEVVPILDDADLEATTVTLPAVTGTRPVTDVHEIPLSIAYTSGATEIGRYGARGVWFSFRITNTSQRSAGEIAVNGAAVEVIPVRETEPGVT